MAKKSARPKPTQQQTPSKKAPPLYYLGALGLAISVGVAVTAAGPIRLHDLLRSLAGADAGVVGGVADAGGVAYAGGVADAGDVTRAGGDLDDSASCRERMSRGDCLADPGTAARCQATCRSLPHSARCAGWARLGYCPRVSAFMLAHCRGACKQHELVCLRNPPPDVLPDCKARVARGECEAEYRRGNSYFLSQCFASCGEADPQLLLTAMLDAVGNTTAPFPSGLVNAAAEVGQVATVHLAADGEVAREGTGGESGRPVRIQSLDDTPRVQGCVRAHIRTDVTACMRTGRCAPRASTNFALHTSRFTPHASTARFTGAYREPPRLPQGAIDS